MLYGYTYVVFGISQFVVSIFLFQDSVKLSIDSTKAAQSAFTCSKLTIKTVEQGVKYVQS